MTEKKYLTLGEGQVLEIRDLIQDEFIGLSIDIDESRVLEAVEKVFPKNAIDKAVEDVQKDMIAHVNKIITLELNKRMNTFTEKMIEFLRAYQAGLDVELSRMCREIAAAVEVDEPAPAPITEETKPIPLTPPPISEKLKNAPEDKRVAYGLAKSGHSESALDFLNRSTPKTDVVIVTVPTSKKSIEPYDFEGIQGIKVQIKRAQNTNKPRWIHVQLHSTADSKLLGRIRNALNANFNHNTKRFEVKYREHIFKKLVEILKPEHAEEVGKTDPATHGVEDLSEPDKELILKNPTEAIPGTRQNVNSGYKRKPPFKVTPSAQMMVEAEIVAEHLAKYNGQAIWVQQIREKTADRVEWGETNGMTNKMRSYMKYQPKIKKAGRGMYFYEMDGGSNG